MKVENKKLTKQRSPESNADSAERKSINDPNAESAERTSSSNAENPERRMEKTEKVNTDQVKAEV